MKLMFSVLSAAFMLCSTTAASAAGEYNKVPAGNGQYSQCLSYAAKLYTGGDEKSPIRGQTKAQAWCTCMWNETPDNFRGNLATFSESRRGKEINKTCEEYSDWGS
jgi:hypothetical protein